MAGLHDEIHDAAAPLTAPRTWTRQVEFGCRVGGWQAARPERSSKCLPPEHGLRRFLALQPAHRRQSHWLLISETDADGSWSRPDLPMP